MDFTKINIDTWDRKENYNWFTTKNRCKINMTMNIDATALIRKIKEKKLSVTLLLLIWHQGF